jgi:hypothetical protein
MPSGIRKIANYVKCLSKGGCPGVSRILQYCTEIPAFPLRPKKAVILGIMTTTSYPRIFHWVISAILKSFRIIRLSQGFWRDDSSLLLMNLKKELR